MASSVSSRVSAQPYPITPKYVPIPDTKEYRQYAAKLKLMSPKELQAEVAKEQEALWCATHGVRYAPEQEKDATIKLELCKKELASRSGTNKDLYRDYQKKVRGMSDERLTQEVLGVRQRLFMAEMSHDPKRIMGASVMLKVAQAEADRRGLKINLPFLE